MHSTNNVVLQAIEHQPTAHSSTSQPSRRVTPSPTRKPMKRSSSSDSENADNDNDLVIDESAVKDVVSLKASPPKMARNDQNGCHNSSASSVNGYDEGHDHQEEMESSAQSSIPTCSTQLQPTTFHIKPSVLQHVKASSNVPHLSLVSTGRLCIQTSTVREVYAKYLSTNRQKDHIYANKLFVLYQIWGLSYDKQYETTNQPLLDLDDCITLDMVSDFLFGVLHTSSPAALVNFLRKKPERLVGKFVVAVLIVEYCLQYDNNILYQFYTHVQSEDTKYYSLVTTITNYIVQRALNRDKNGDIDVTEIPTAILNSVNLTGDTILTELSKLHIISDFLNECLWVYTADLCYPDNHLYEKSLYIWSRIASLVCMKRPYSPNGSLSDLVLLSDLEHRVNTKPFFSLFVDDKEQDVHLHEHIVHKYSATCGPCVRSNVRVSKKDLHLFLKLLYKINVPESWVPDVTMEVLEMAKLIGISDLWDFWFFKNSFVNVWDYDKQKFNVLRLAVKAKLVKFLKEMGPTIRNYLFDMDNKREAVKDLSKEDLLFLCEQVEFDQFELYKLVLHWSYSLCNKIIQNYEEINYSADVAERFNQVQHVLVLEKMTYSTLCKLHSHRYYNPVSTVVKEMYNRKTYQRLEM